MPIISYIKECTSFIAFASDSGLSANEFVLWHALLNVFNQRATGNVWSGGFIPVSNSRLLSFTPFGCGNSAVETLRKTRDKLLQRGLIKYQAGQRNKAKPLYQMIYFCPFNDEQPAPDVDNLCKTSKSQNVTQQLLGNMQGNTQGKTLGNMKGNTQGNTLGKPLDISYVDIDNDQDDYQDDYDTGREVNPSGYPVTQIHTHNQSYNSSNQRGRARGLPWYDPNDPEADCDETYRESDRGRAAIAQRILDHFSRYEIKRDSENIHGLMCDAMKAGLHPSLIQQAAKNCTTTSEWERKILKQAALIGCELDSARNELYALKLQRGATDDVARQTLRYRRELETQINRIG